MKTFKDTVTGQFWQFDDVDDVRIIGGIVQVFDVNGNRIKSVPETLEPAELPTPPEPTIDDLKQELFEAATQKRWEVMTGGLTLPNGVLVGTTDEDHNRMTAVVVGAPLSGLTEESVVDFKSNNGFIKITIGEIKEIVGLIGLHWQACFSAEHAHYAAIQELETVEQIEEYWNEINSGWPSTDLRPPVEEETDPEQPEDPPVDEEEPETELPGEEEQDPTPPEDEETPIEP